MSKLKRIYDEECGILKVYYNDELLTEIVCDGGDPEVEMNEVIDIFNAGQAAALSEVVFTEDDAISIVNTASEFNYSEEDVELVMDELKHVQTVLLVNRANKILKGID